MGKEETDEQLMLRVKNGDSGAFTVLVNRYKQAVINIAAHTIGSSIFAEDIAQQVFIQVYRNADSYEVKAKFSTWIFTITKNLSFNEIRRLKRHPADSMDASISGDNEDEDSDSFSQQIADPRDVAPNQALLNKESVERLREALKELPEKQRYALLLLEEQGLSYDEISKMLKCSLASTKSLIFRARETLKSKLRKYFTN